MKPKILLTGATGTIGQYVLAQLLDRGGYDLTVFATQSAKNKRYFARYASRLKVLYGNIARLEEVEALQETFDAVIHLAAIIPPLADENPERTQAVNTLGTQNLLQVLERYSPRVFFLYSSSIAVYGDRLEQPQIRVSDGVGQVAHDAYALSKIAAEKAVQESSLDWTIFRLTAIMGIQNHKMSKLMFHMPLDTPMEIATPEDTARAFVHALEKRQQLTRRVFNLGGGEACRISYRDFLSQSFAIYGLGVLDFPEKTFAEKNFHCGHYADGDDLEKIVGFQQQDLEYYFQMTQKSIPVWQKIATQLLRRPIKYFLEKQSEPLAAFRRKDVVEMERFF